MSRGRFYRARGTVPASRAANATTPRVSRSRALATRSAPVATCPHGSTRRRTTSTEAEQTYRTALRIDPSFAPTYVNLADLYRAQGRDEAGEHILRQGLAVYPNDAALHHALGLLLVRRGQQSEALGALGRAAALSPDNPRYSYVFGVALHSAHQSTRALEVLKQAQARHPGDPELLVGLATISRERGQLDAATGYARKLVELVPHDQGARQLLVELEAQRH
jgi:Flp pilus assembly protein TadD